MDRTKIQKEFVSGVDQSVFRWFGHVNRIAESVWLISEVMGRPRLCWRHGVNLTFGSRGMTVEAAR